MANPKGKGGFADHPELINRNGRPPKGEARIDLIKQMLNMSKDELEKFCRKKNTPSNYLTIHGLIKKAVEGDSHIHRLLLEYIDGKPPQKLEHGGYDGGPLKIIFPVEEDGTDDQSDA